MKTNKRIAISLIPLLTLSGCEFIGPQFKQKLQLPTQESAFNEGEISNPASDNAQRVAKVEIFTNNESTINALPAGAHRSGQTAGEYSLNFDDADIYEVVKVILGDILGQNYSISPQVNGKVTLQTTKALSKDELIPTLEMLLNINNAALIEHGSTYLIKPSTEALYSSSVKIAGTTKMPGGYQTRVVPVKNVSATEIVDILKPLLPEKSLIQAEPNRNILLVAGSGADLARITELIAIFDTPVLKGQSFGLFTPARVNASKIIEELNELFNQRQSKEGSGSPLIRFIEIERLNAILAITHNTAYLHDIENWIYRLDRVSPDATGGVHVYKAQHVAAADLAETLGNIFGASISGTGAGKGASIASGRKATSLSSKTGSGSSSGGLNNSGSTSGPGSSTNTSAALSGGSSDSKSTSSSTKSSSKSSSVGSLGSLGSGSAAGQGNGEMANVRIIPDENNNALVIMASAQEYESILKVLNQLDTLPQQVMIDVTILSVKLTDTMKYGIEWYLQFQKDGDKNIAGGGGGLPINLSDIAKSVGTGGFNYAFQSGSKDITAVLNAAAANNNLNIISSPSLMVLNNQEASIKVGDSVPTLSGTSSNFGGVVQSVQMMDTGINLVVRPRVNASGLVLMDINQSVNDVAPASSATSIQQQTPAITKRELQTNIAVQSGETIVLGGLIREEDTDNKNGVPLLHKLPLLGPIFGGTDRSKIKTELVLLITPRVMKTRQDSNEVTNEFKRKLPGIFDIRDIPQ